jgi:hypothetical protein
VRGVSPYCRVIGERPAHERRHPVADAPPASAPSPAEDAPMVAGFTVINHPCPRCMGTEVLVTHRGVMLTTLFCTACRHGWGEPPAAIASAPRTDRRAMIRGDSADRRSADRLVPPMCEYCGTNAHVQPVRRTASEIYFVCASCDAM